MGGRDMPIRCCPHGAIIDWGDFGPEGGPGEPEPCAECDAERAKDHRLAQVPGGHPVVPLPVHWRMGAHGDPIAVFDNISLHLWPDGSVTWSDETRAHATKGVER